MAPRKPRKQPKLKPPPKLADQPVKLMQSHSPAALAGLASAKPRYDMDAAARVAYESFVRQLGMKVGQKVSDASGLHRIPSWDQHKSFVKTRWRAVAQAVIDAATGKPA